MYASTARFRLRRVAAAGIATAAVFGLAACGDDSDSSAPNAESSAETSSDTGSGDSGSTGGGDLSAGDEVSAAEMTDVLSTATSSMTTAHMTMDMAMKAQGQSMNMSGEGDVQMKPLAQHMTMDMMGQKIEMIMVDDFMYMNGGQGGWIKMSLDDVAKQSGLGEAADTMTNPLAAVEMMSGSIKGATFEGEEDVDGVEASHYTVEIDSQKYFKNFGAAASAAGSMPDTMEQELWVDEEGRMVQSKVSLGAMGDVTVNVTEHGEPVDIKAPPKSQVTEM